MTQLCSQTQIRDEDRGPPPSAPPLLLSVIPGGFIKQLVRETEQEAKAARRRKESRVGTKEEVSTEGSHTAPSRELDVPRCPQVSQQAPLLCLAARGEGRRGPRRAGQRGATAQRAEGRGAGGQGGHSPLPKGAAP